MSPLGRTVRLLKGEPVCDFDWPGDIPMGPRTGCDGEPIGMRDGKRACAAHLKPYECVENKPYEDEP